MKILSSAIVALWLVLPTFTSGAVMRYSYDIAGRMSMAEYSCVKLRYTYDTVDNILSNTIEIKNDYKGDVDNNDVVDLIDAILALQVVAGTVPSKMIHLSCQVDDDNKIGLGEAIFVMQKVVGVTE